MGRPAAWRLLAHAAVGGQQCWKCAHWRAIFRTVAAVRTGHRHRAIAQAAARQLPSLLDRRCQMPTTMRAAVVRAFGQPLSIEDVPIPTPGPGEVLVKIMASGVCHTDLHAAAGDWPVKPTLPFIPGHEGAGIVVALGAGVSGLREGDPVGIAWLHDACGACEHCITGWETLCEAQHNSGYGVNGSFAEYAIGAAAYVGRLPERPDFSALAPILCAGVTTYKGIKETEARPGEWIVVSGVGGLGHVAIQYARAMGLHVAAVDVTSDKLAMARALGAEVVVNGRTSGAVEEVLRATGGGAHGVLVTAVSVAAFGQALRMVRRKGTVSLVGLPPGDFPTPIFDVVLKRITIRGSIVGTRQDLTEALAFATDGRVTAHVNHARLEDVNEVFHALKAGQVDGRMVLDIGLSSGTTEVARHEVTA
jgi:propanol-preferring alcohol dehydrogenase